MMRFLTRTRIFLVLTILSINLYANDLIVQKVILKNGSMYEGYIVSQKIGSKNFVFRSFCSTISLPRNKFKNVTIASRDRDTSKLSENWKTWAKENDVIRKDGERGIIPLSTIITDNSELHDVYIKDLGEKIKYVSMKEEDIILHLDSLVEIRVPARSQACLSGLNREYELGNGNRIQGEYRGEFYGDGKDRKKIKIQTEDGTVDIDKDDVVKCIFIPYNKEQLLYEQTPLIDVVKIKEGKEYEGVITEHNFSDNNDSFITVMKKNGLMNMISYNNITEFVKKKNEGYKPRYDVILKKGEFALNDSSLVFRENSNFKNAVNVSVGEKCRIESDSLNTRSFKRNEKIVLYSYHGSEIQNEQFVMIPITKEVATENKDVKKNTKEKNDEKDIKLSEFYKLDFKDIITKQILPIKVSGPTKNGTAKYEFKVSPGDYILLDFLRLNYVILKIQ